MRLPGSKGQKVSSGNEPLSRLTAHSTCSTVWAMAAMAAMAAMGLWGLRSHKVNTLPWWFLSNRGQPQWTSRSEWLEFLGVPSDKKNISISNPPKKKHKNPRQTKSAWQRLVTSSEFLSIVHRLHPSYSLGVLLRIYSWVNQRRVNHATNWFQMWLDSAECPVDFQCLPLQITKMVEGCLRHFTPVHNLHTTVITNKVDTSISPLDPQNLGALSASALLAPKTQISLATTYCWSCVETGSSGRLRWLLWSEKLLLGALWIPC